MHRAAADSKPAPYGVGRIESGVYGGHDPEAAHGHSFAEILAVIEHSGLSARVKERASRIFRTVAEAEARVHGIEVDAVHFHEVGAVDSIVDVCAAALALELLDIGLVASSAIAIGTGTATMAHGSMPLPAPAAAIILQGLPVRWTNVTDELVTPTGAAILACLVDRFTTPGDVRLLASGFGAGSTDRADPANVLRAVLYEGEGTDAAGRDLVEVLEFQVDDMSGEALGYLREQLEAAGALDVLMAPVAMKKNRPGTAITVIAERERLAGLLEIAFVDGTTLGIRHRTSARIVLDRRIETIDTPYGPIRVKVALFDERIVHVSPEHDDCAAAARRHRVALTDVVHEVRSHFAIH